MFLLLTGNWQIGNNGVFVNWGVLRFSLYSDNYFNVLGFNYGEPKGHNFALFYSKLDKDFGMQILIGNRLNQKLSKDTKWYSGNIE